MEEEDEDKILLEREYKKHIQNIKKSRTREKHFKYKNIGYTEALENYEEDLKYFSILFGFLEQIQNKKMDFNNTAKEIKFDINDFIDLLSKEMTFKKINIKDLTMSIINGKLKTKEEIEEYLKDKQS